MLAERDAGEDLEYWLFPPTGLWSLFSEADQATLRRRGARRLYVKGQSVFSAGEPSDTVYVVISGDVKIYQGAVNGKEIIHWVCGVGEVFGIADLFGGRRRVIGAQARGPTELLCISRGAFTEFLAERPEAALEAIELLGRRMRCLSRALTIIASEDVTARLARLLLGLARPEPAPAGRAEPALCLDASYTHQELADMVGASRQTVTGALNELKRRGVLDWTGRRICVTSVRGLADVLHRPGA